MEPSAFYTMKGYELAADTQITTAMEDYLEMICRLDAEKAGPIRIRALSQQLHVKPSSASKMVSNLREKGLVTAEKYGEIHLTDSGRAAAERIYERRRFFAERLLALGIDPATAEADACRLGHAISAESFARLKGASGQQ